MTPTPTFHLFGILLLLGTCASLGAGGLLLGVAALVGRRDRLAGALVAIGAVLLILTELGTGDLSTGILQAIWRGPRRSYDYGSLQSEETLMWILDVRTFLGLAGRTLATFSLAGAFIRLSRKE